MERLFAADRFLTVGPFPALKRRTCLAERGHSCRQLLPNATTGRFAVRFPQRPLLRTGMSALRAKRVRNAGLLSVVLPGQPWGAHASEFPKGITLEPPIDGHDHSHVARFSWIRKRASSRSTPTARQLT